MNNEDLQQKYNGLIREYCKLQEENKKLKKKFSELQEENKILEESLYDLQEENINENLYSFKRQRVFENERNKRRSENSGKSDSCFYCFVYMWHGYRRIYI